MKFDDFIISVYRLAILRVLKTMPGRKANCRVIQRGLRARGHNISLDVVKTQVTLNGTLYPEYKGREQSLDDLHELALTGEAQMVTAGNGDILGKWIIVRQRIRRSNLLSNGMGRKIEFSVTLKFAGKRARS